MSLKSTTTDTTTTVEREVIGPLLFGWTSLTISNARNLGAFYMWVWVWSRTRSTFLSNSKSAPAFFGGPGLIWPRTEKPKVSWRRLKATDNSAFWNIYAWKCYFKKWKRRKFIFCWHTNCFFALHSRCLSSQHRGPRWLWAVIYTSSENYSALCSFYFSTAAAKSIVELSNSIFWNHGQSLEYNFWKNPLKLQLVFRVNYYYFCSKTLNLYFVRFLRLIFKISEIFLTRRHWASPRSPPLHWVTSPIITVYGVRPMRDLRRSSWTERDW